MEVHFDVHHRLIVGWRQGHLICVVPWLVEYLKMMKYDRIATHTKYYKNVLNTLKQIRIRPLQPPTFFPASTSTPTSTSTTSDPSKTDDDQWNETTQFLAIQIEQLFEVLDLSIHNPDYNDADAKESDKKEAEEKKAPVEKK